MSDRSTDVAVVGLGRMGSALARTLHANGLAVHGWSRSAERRENCRDYCRPARSLDEAVRSAPLIILCLPDYESSFGTLATVRDELQGRVIVQLSSGGPGDALALGEWVTAAGAQYLDGAIATFPRGIGDAATTIFLSGAKQAWSDHAASLRFLGGRTVFIGEDVTAAATADLAWLSMYYGIAMGLLQGTAFCEAGGIDPAVFFDAVPSFMVEFGAAGEEYRTQIARRDYSGRQATIAVHRAALGHLQLSARATSVDPRIVDLASEILDEAITSGRGELEIAAAIDMLRSPGT